MVGMLLESVGHTVSCAANGLSGLRRAQAEQPDLILMDLGLPQLDGCETTRRLRSDYRTAHIPVLAFTANVAQSALEEARAAGCCGLIAKPFDIDYLLAVVGDVLARRDAGEQERAVSF